jgi:hypothetical protein
VITRKVSLWPKKDRGITGDASGCITSPSGV